MILFYLSYVIPGTARVFVTSYGFVTADEANKHANDLRLVHFAIHSTEVN